MASHITNELSYRLITQFQRRMTKGSLIDAFQSPDRLAARGRERAAVYRGLRPAGAGPRALLTHVARRFIGTVPQPLRNEKRAWFTDTLEDVNGVARTIRAMVKAAGHAGADLTVVTSRPKISITDIPIKNFAPVGEFEIPEYELQKLSFPPFLDMLDYVQQERFTEIIISTPGPIGLCALGCAKLLGLRTSGIYHTDFPQYARFLSDDAFMESMVWNYMQWFYGQTDLLYVNSEFYRRCWIDRGIVPDKLRIFPRGLDTELFNPAQREPDFWKKRGGDGRGHALCGAGIEGEGPEFPGRDHAGAGGEGAALHSGDRGRGAVPQGTGVAAAAGNFYRHTDRAGVGRGLRVSGPVCLPEYDGHIRERGGGSDGGGGCRSRCRTLAGRASW